MLGQRPQPRPPPPHQTQVNTKSKLVGVANETVAIVNNRRCKCLVDTGSQITTISKTFYDLYCKDVTLHSVDDFFCVEGATAFPFLIWGYIEVPIILPGALPGLFELDAPVLVVADTPNNQRKRKKLPSA